MSLESLKRLCNMIKVKQSFASECEEYLKEMDDMFASIPVTSNQNSVSHTMIQNIESIDCDRARPDNKDVLNSTNITGEYFKSKRSVVHS